MAVPRPWRTPRERTVAAARPRSGGGGETSGGGELSCLLWRDAIEGVDSLTRTCQGIGGHG